MRIVTWNINGLRSAEDEFLQLVDKTGADILALQEVKAHPDQIGFMLKMVSGYDIAWNWAKRSGYSGTAVYYRSDLAVKEILNNFEKEEFSEEGRSIEIVFKQFSFINIYTPLGNKIKEGERKSYRQSFLQELEKRVQTLNECKRDFIIVGDFNVVPSKLDVYDGNINRDWVVFEEWNRYWYYNFLKNFNVIDVFREKFPDKMATSWWAYWDKSREKGLRLDYVFCSKNLYNKVTNIEIWKDWKGSDHCPILCDFNL